MDDLESFAEWRGGMGSRVSTLEATVEREPEARARMGEDMSGLKVQFTQQDRLLLKDYTEILKDHTDRLTRLETGLAKVHVGVQTIIGLLNREIGGNGSGGGGIPSNLN